MSTLRILLGSLATLLFTLGNAHAQYVYIKHPEVLVKQGATAAVLPANPLRAFVYCVIASPRKGEPLAPSVVTMGDATTGVAVYYPDHPPHLWANTGAVRVFSDQVALISCTELAIPPQPKTNPTGLRDALGFGGLFSLLVSSEAERRVVFDGVHFEAKVLQRRKSQLT